MDHSTPHAPTLNGVPHLGRAEAVLYLILFYIFGHIHPRYQTYIDALAAHDRLNQICQTADHLQARFGLCPAPVAQRPPWRDTNLPEIYFALIYAIRLKRSCRWAALAGARYTYQIFPAIEPD